MDKTNDAQPKKKGILSILKESIAKANEGCGPGCGCHAEKEKAKGSETTKDSKKE